MAFGSVFSICVAACNGGEHVLGRDCPELIDDMEDGNPSIISKGRVGEWFSYNDRSDGSIQRPPASAEVFPMETLSPPRGSSLRAVHTSGSGFTGVWGAGVGFDLQLKNAYDASKYRGISFLARAGEDADLLGRTLRVNVPDGNTAAAGGRCEGEQCNDDFGKEVQLGNEFIQYELDFDELTQAGWSGKLFEKLTLKELYGIRFQSQPNSKFDFWIDDVAFTCR
ncbi:MAG TPA: hypothetical protein VFQ61_11120 [Polyangiaceae bacterium]|nr:hypothetical protein [Polyangiaceae bacterium]